MIVIDAKEAYETSVETVEKDSQIKMPPPPKVNIYSNKFMNKLIPGFAKYAKHKLISPLRE